MVVLMSLTTIIGTKAQSKNISMLLIESSKESKQSFYELNSWGGGLHFCNTITFLINTIQTTMKLWVMRQIITLYLKELSERKSQKIIVNKLFFMQFNFLSILFHLKNLDIS